MAGDVEGFPPFIQGIIYLGSVVSVVIATIIGGRKRHKEPDEEHENSRLAAIERELAAQKDRDSTRRERDRTDRDLVALRNSIEENLQQVIKALHEPIGRQITEINHQLVEIKQQLGRRRLSRRG